MRVLDNGFVVMTNHMGDDNTIVASARVSLLGESKGIEQDTKLIKYLLKNRHTSPFEQVEFQFMVKCPIFVARQWHRHRTWSYNEVSRRYTSEKIDFHVPFSFREQAETNRQSSSGIHPNSLEYIKAVEEHSKKSYELYEYMIQQGVCREQARMVLPQNMFTSFYAKTDLHNLFHFLELRRSLHSQFEIRMYATAIELLIRPIVPIAFDAWEELQRQQN